MSVGRCLLVLVVVSELHPDQTGRNYHAIYTGLYVAVEVSGREM